MPEIDISTTTQGGPIDEVQRVGVTGNYLQGTFTLMFDGQTTSAIAVNASAATVKAALEALSNVAANDIAVVKLQDTANAHEWKLSFQGGLAAANQPQTTIDTTKIMVLGGSPGPRGGQSVGPQLAVKAVHFRALMPMAMAMPTAAAAPTANTQPITTISKKPRLKPIALLPIW